MEQALCCHSCGAGVDALTARCPTCYVALSGARRAPSPLRAAAPQMGQLALALVPWPTPPSSVSGPGPASQATAVGPARVLPGPWSAPGSRVSYASWGRRIAGALIDASVFVPALLTAAVGVLAGVVLLAAAVVFTAWQHRRLQVRTGQTLGKHAVGIFVPPTSDLPVLGRPSTRPLTTSGRPRTARYVRTAPGRR